MILVVTAGLWQNQRIQGLNVFDQPFYLGIAHDVIHEGRFTDGYMFAQPGERPSGMRFAPLYPGLVAVAASVDPALRRGMDCVVDSAGQDDACPRRAPVLRGLQFVELATFFWLAWWVAGAVGGEAVGWATLVLALVCAPLLLRSVAYLMTEMTCLVLATGAMAAGVQAVRRAGRGRLAWACAAGMLLGLTALTKPGYVYLAPMVVAACVLLGRRRAAVPLAGFVAGLALVLAPWVVRNDVVLGRAALTYGYDSHTLVQRIAFDTMTWREYARSYLCWLPDGTAMGRTWLGPHACDRFAWDDQPSSFYVLGLRHMLPETLAAAGGYDHHLRYLLTHYILVMPVKHLLVSIPLALRGAYVGHWWGFVLLPAALAWTVLALRRAWTRRPGDWDAGLFLVVALPAWFMLAFNAAVAVNQVRYNLLLIPLYALAGGLSLRWLAHRAGLLGVPVAVRG